jgi:hypothetical protein
MESQMNSCPIRHENEYAWLAGSQQLDRLNMRDEPVSVPGGDDPKPQLDPEDDPETIDENKKNDRLNQQEKRKN